MTIIEALTLAKDKPGTRVRPVCWEHIYPDHWVEFIPMRHQEPIFVEKGTFEEMPHRLRMQWVNEFLAPWEVVE